MRRIFLLIGLLLTSSIFPFAAYGADYYVATGGNDSGNGSSALPWRTIGHAVRQVSAGDTVIVRDGVYNGGTYTTRSFSDWVTVRAENPYHAKLTNVENGDAGTIVHLATRGSAKIIIEGFIFSNMVSTYVCPYRHSDYLVHFENAEDVILRNNILHGNNASGGCNELLKINRSGDPYYPKNITIQGNLFYDPANAGGADLIDSVRPGELDIVENIFFARNAPNAQSFITLKTEVIAASLNITPRSPRYRISRNVFLNWDGRTDQAFIQLGEDGHAQTMITDALIENNLMIGNRAHRMAAPIQLKGPRNVTVRANTIVGDFPGNSAFGFRIGTEGQNPQVRDIFIYNNIWADPAGTMGNRFINNFNDVLISSIRLDNNLYWNGGNSLPDVEDPPPSDDQNRVVADPLLESDQSNVVLPVFNEATYRFTSGNVTIRQEFERLVNTYGAIPHGSPAVGTADPARMPEDDILGRSRGSDPDIGAFENQDDHTASPAPTNLRITGN